MGRILLFLFLGGLGVWAYTASASGPSARPLGDHVAATPERVTFVPIPVYIPPSNRSGSTRGPRVSGGGPSFGK